jgi:hypothetical protein
MLETVKFIGEEGTAERVVTSPARNSLEPTELIAAILSKYLVAGAAEVTLKDKDVEALALADLAFRHVEPPSVEYSTVKLVMFLPPLYVGALQDSLNPLA